MPEPLSDIGASIAAKAAARVKAKAGGSPPPATKPAQAAPAPAPEPEATEAPEGEAETETAPTGQPEGEKPKLSQDDLQKLVDEGHEDQVMAILGIKVGAARARRAKRKEAEAAAKDKAADEKLARVTQQAADIRRQYTPYALLHGAITEQRWADVAAGIGALLPQGMSWGQLVSTIGEQGAVSGGEAALQRRVAQLEQMLRNGSGSGSNANSKSAEAGSTPAAVAKPRVVIGEALKAHAVSKVPDWQDLVRAEMRRHKKEGGGFKITLTKAADNVLARHRRQPAATAQEKPRVRDQAGRYSAPAAGTEERPAASIDSIFEKAKLRAKRSEVGARR